MMRSRTVKYAMIAILQLGREPSRARRPSDLAMVNKLPERLLVQILRCLETNGILHSADGTYRLARPLSQISLLDLIDAVEGRWDRESLGFPFLCGESEATLKSVLQQAIGEYRRALNGIKLSTLTLISTEAEPIASRITAYLDAGRGNPLS